VFLVWSTLREQRFDAARKRAVELENEGAWLRLQADLCASARYFDEAYRLASLAPADVQRGAHYARLALFTDALGDTAAASQYSEQAVITQSREATLEWIVWLSERCSAYSAAAHMLRAYERHVPHDPRAPWWLAQVLAALPGANAKAEHRKALSRAYAHNPVLHPDLPLQFSIACREIRAWRVMEAVAREALARNPTDAEMAWQLSHVQWQRNDAAGAEATMRVVDQVAPDNATVVAAIGFLRRRAGAIPRKQTVPHAALALDAKAVTPAVDLAELELRRGDWRSAWPRYEARLAREDRTADNIVNVMARLAPRWRGEPLAGKTLLVHSE
jgi:hypothetical protein